MDSVTSSPEGDWAERKELKKNARYGMHIYFINHLSALHGRPWNCTQANFMVGARGSLKQNQFQDRLLLLRVTNSKARDKIRALTVSKTPALSDIILKPFHVSILRSPEWAQRGVVPGPVDSASAPVSSSRDNYLPTQSQALYYSASSSPSARRRSSGVNKEDDVRANATVVDGQIYVRAL